MMESELLVISDFNVDEGDSEKSTELSLFA
jgi:hypothetical protein